MWVVPSVPEFGLSLALRAEGVYELDLTEKMHHFYLWGKLDNETLPVIPGVKDIKKSYINKSRKKYNGEKWRHIVHCDLTVKYVLSVSVSQVYNDVDYDAGRFLGGGGQVRVGQHTGLFVVVCCHVA